ncbi:MAG TPA: threonine/serine dehydratase [Anaerolineae bacterium]|nr:threonine/serine dehydratase [Anaerolineae bacterium]
MTNHDSIPDQVTLADVQAAADCLIGVALRTPLLAFGPFDDEIGAARAWLKPENLQPIGAFKIRGAYNALATLSPQERSRGVVTHSSGNHAQGIARAARMLGMRAVIVMPEDAPAIKVAGVRADGAEIDFVGADNEERIRRADELAAEHGLVLIPSFDDARIVAGQGTVGLEIVEQMAELGRANEPLTVLVPIGGGGLSSGVCVAVKGLRPDAAVIGVEPELAADTAESIREDRIVRWPPELTGRTIADGVRTSAVGRIPFAHLRRLLDDVVTVSEDDIRRAMVEAATRSRIVAEPSGALAIAAWLRHGSALPNAEDGDTVMVVSGGNVDPETYRRLLTEAAALG